MDDATRALVDEAPVFDTHEHFSPVADIVAAGADVVALLRRSYVGFHDFFPGLRSGLIQFERYPDFQGNDSATVASFLEAYDLYNFLPVAASGIELVHGISPLDTGRLDVLNARIREAHLQPRFREETLASAGVTRAILDVPHHACGLHPDLRREFPEDRYGISLRINSFLFGFDPACWTPGTSTIRHAVDTLGILDGWPGTLDDHLRAVSAILDGARHRIASFKCASAYERTIDFGPAPGQPGHDGIFEQARGIAGKPFEAVAPAGRLAWGNVVFHHVMDHVEGWDLPVQVHAGTAIQDGSHPRLLEPVIDRYPGIHFCILHAGFPWTGDALDIAARHDNVSVDLAWLPFLSRDETARFIHEVVRRGLDGKIMAFGGDCGTVEGSIGALHALKGCMATALDRLLEQRVITRQDVAPLARALLHDNARARFRA